MIANSQYGLSVFNPEEQNWNLRNEKKKNYFHSFHTAAR